MPAAPAGEGHISLNFPAEAPQAWNAEGVDRVRDTLVAMLHIAPEAIRFIGHNRLDAFVSGPGQQAPALPCSLTCNYMTL